MTSRPWLGAPVALFIAVLAVSWAAILIRTADAPPIVIAFWRLTLATAILAPLAAWFRRRDQGGLGVDRTRQTSLLVLAAGLLLALHFACWIYSLTLTSVASSVMLVSTQPIFAALLGQRILEERPVRRTWWAILLSLGGALLIGFGDFSSSITALLGDALALAAAGAAAIYLMLGRKARASGPLPIYLFKVNGVAAFFLLLGCWSGGWPLLAYSLRTWAAFVALAAGPHLAGHGLLNLAVRELPAPTVNLALLGEPILSSAYAAWLFREFPGGWFYAGAALVLSGLLLEFGWPRGVSSVR